jgi:hypothetical protein
MEAKGRLRGLVSAGWIDVGERMSAISNEAESRDLTIDKCKEFGDKVAEYWQI